MVILGNLAWAFQNGTGNRGDDFRALRLCELQPYEMNHPNNRDKIYAILGLQSEHKAGGRGMKSARHSNAQSTNIRLRRNLADRQSHIFRRHCTR